jgi:hypothetical protein
MEKKTTPPKSEPQKPKTPSGIPVHKPDTGVKIGNNGMPKYQTPPPPPPKKKN